MPKTHNLKTWPQYFAAVRLGNKTFEIRRDDRDYEVGDTLALQEYCSETKQFTGEIAQYRVTYCLRAEPFVPAGYVAMGIVPLEDKCGNCQDRQLLAKTMRLILEQFCEGAQPQGMFLPKA